MKKFKKIISLVTLLTLLFSFAPTPVFASATDGTINTNNRYAWCENIGWLDFGTAGGAVHVTDSKLSGYAWNDNVGWVNLFPSNSGVTNNGEGVLGGYAWGENVGWINFKPACNGVTINSSGNFSGYAWGENVGWCSFNTTNYKVSTDWRPASARPTPAEENSNSGGGSGGGGSGGGGSGGGGSDDSSKKKPPPLDSAEFSFSINNGATITNTTDVTLLFFAKEPASVEKILISEKKDFSKYEETSFKEKMNWVLSKNDGDKKIFVKFSFKKNNESLYVDLSKSIKLDTIPPKIPTLEKPANKEVLEKPRPIFKGSGDPNSKVFLEINDVLLYQAITDKEGEWTFEPKSDFAYGQHAVKLYAQDDAENKSPEVTSSFTIFKPAEDNQTTEPAKKPAQEGHTEPPADKDKDINIDKPAQDITMKKPGVLPPVKPPLPFDLGGCNLDTWICKNWEPCENGAQTRKCSLLRDCPRVITIVPENQRRCEVEPERETIRETDTEELDQNEVEQNLLEVWEPILGNDYGIIIAGSKTKLADVDGDGLSEEKEKEMGTDPLLYDTDGDGVNDFLDPFPLDSSRKGEDEDQDGVPDDIMEEIAEGGEITIDDQTGSRDTDGDGLSDGYEILIGTNPVNEDTDNDGISDGEENLLYRSDANDEDSTANDDLLITNINSGDILPPEGIQVTGTLPTDFGEEDSLGVWMIDQDRRLIHMGNAHVFNNDRFVFVTTEKLKKGQYLVFVKSDTKEGGETIQSQTVLVQIGKNSPLKEPQLKTLADIPLTADQLLKKLRVEITEDKDVVLSGISDPGTQVIANWESAIFFSAILADKPGSLFRIKPPKKLEPGDHRVVVYARKIEKGQTSPAVSVNFHISQKGDLENVEIASTEPDTATEKPGVFTRAKDGIVNVVKAIGRFVQNIWRFLISFFAGEESKTISYMLPTVRPPDPRLLEKNILMTKYGDFMVEEYGGSFNVIRSSTLKGFIKPKRQIADIVTDLYFLRPDNGNLRNTENDNTSTPFASVLNVPRFPSKEAAFSNGLHVASYAYKDINEDSIYETDLKFPSVDGSYNLETVIHYSDGSETKLNMPLSVKGNNSVFTLKKGRRTPVKNAKVSLYKKDNTTNEFYLFSDAEVIQKNPQVTGGGGSYSFFASKGTYYIEVTRENYEKYVSDIFTLTANQYIKNRDIYIKPQ